MATQQIYLLVKPQEELLATDFATWGAEVQKMNNTPLTKLQLQNGWCTSFLKAVGGDTFDEAAASSFNNFLHKVKEIAKNSFTYILILFAERCPSCCRWYQTRPAHL